MGLDDICDFEGVPYPQSPHPILLTDGDMRCVGANQAVLDLLGYQISDLMSKSILELEPGDWQPDGDRLGQRLAADGDQIGVYRLLTRGGDTIQVRYHAIAEVAPGVHLFEFATVS